MRKILAFILILQPTFTFATILPTKVADFISNCNLGVKRFATLFPKQDAELMINFGKQECISHSKIVETKKDTKEIDKYACRFAVDVMAKEYQVTTKDLKKKQVYEKCVRPGMKIKD